MARIECLAIQVENPPVHLDGSAFVDNSAVVRTAFAELDDALAAFAESIAPGYGMLEDACMDLAERADAADRRPDLARHDRAEYLAAIGAFPGA